MEENNNNGETEDPTLELDIIETDCVKCGVCFEEAPEAFEEREEGVAKVKEGWQERADEDDVARAVEMCPTDCIEPKVAYVEPEQVGPEATADGGEGDISSSGMTSADGGDPGDGPSIEEMSDEEIEDSLEELERLRTKVDRLEDDYAEDTPSFEDRKENTSGLAKLTYEYFERSRKENKRVMDQKSYKEVALQPFWPHEMVRNLSIASFFIGSIVLISALMPPHIAQPANLGSTPSIILPDWYLYWSFGLLKLGPVNPELAFLGGEKIMPDRTYGVLANLVVVGIIAMLPFVNTGKARRPVEEPFWASLGVAGVTFAVMISILSVKNLVANFPIMGFTITPGLLLDLTFLLPIAAALVTYPILKSFQKGYMYDLNRRYFKLR